MRVAPAPATDPLWEACFEAAVETGHPRNGDSNGPVAEGTSWNDVNVVDGKRQSAADFYLSPFVGRSNLKIVTDAQVLRLLMEHTTCHGVEYRVGEQMRTAFASQEVVLAAGTVGSPQLLLLSRIGPGQHLRELGIDVRADIPGVGANLQDHRRSQVSFTSTRPVRAGLYARKPHVLLRSEPSTTPDLQIIFNDFPVHPRSVPGSEDGYSVVFSLMTPASRGTVRLASSDPYPAPLIDPSYLTDPSDVARMIAGLRVAREIGGALSLASFRRDEVFPGRSTQSNVACHTYLRSTVSSYFHPVGTCKIGTDEMSVVDAQLKVHGIEHLRIADASLCRSWCPGTRTQPFWPSPSGQQVC